MWPFKKKASGDLLKLKISGMHCSSCAMNIDNSIEDIDGVIASKTNYAEGETEVEFKPGSSVKAQVKKAIEKLGYKVI